MSSTLLRLTAKEILLERAPPWTEAQAVAVLRVIEAQTELEKYFDDEAKLSPAELDAREDAWALENACDAIRDEPW